MSNPFLQAKRQVAPRQHPTFRNRKYPEVWKMSVDELKKLYEETTDGHKRGAITRAINEKLGLKTISQTHKQRLARDLNYLLFISSGFKNQLVHSKSSLSYHLQRNPEDTLLLGLLHEIQLIGYAVQRIEQRIQARPKESDKPRKRVRNKKTWQNVLHVGE